MSERQSVAQRFHLAPVVLGHVLVKAKRQAGASGNSPVQVQARIAAIARQADTAYRRPLVEHGEAGIRYAAVHAESSLPKQVRLQTQMTAASQRPVAARPHAGASLPSLDGLRGGLEAEAIAADLVETIGLDVGVLQVEVRRHLHAAKRHAIAAFTIGDVVATVTVAGDALHVTAQLQVTAYVLEVCTNTEPPHRVPLILDHTAVHHAFDGAAMALVGEFVEAAQVLALAHRKADHAVAAQAKILAHHPAAQVVSHAAVAIAIHAAVVAQHLRPAAHASNIT